MKLDLVRHDLAVAVRNAVRRPAFTLLVVFTLAVGLGVNAGIFALIDGVLLRPLPYHRPDRLVFLWQTLPRQNVFEVEATPADYIAWHRLESFSSLAMVAADSYSIGGDGEAERVRGARVTASLMPLLGVAPRIGRAFVAAEDDSGADRVAMLSDGLWRRRFGSDPAVLGRTVQVDGVAHTVVGVMPPDAILPGPLAANSELWLPARMTPDERVNDISHNYTVIGRLADSVTLAQASGEIAAFAEAMAAAAPSHKNLGARIVTITEDTVRGIRPALIALLGGVAVLLLAASANVSSLLLARAVSRTHESAVRTALGATVIQLFWHDTAETIVLTTLGAASGLVLGGALLKAFVPLFADALPPTGASIAIGPRVIGAIAALTLLLGLGLGALVSRRRDGRPLADALKASARMSPAPDVVRARSALVVAQVAFAVLLLASAGVLLRSVTRLARVTPGFSADHVLTFRLALDSGAYDSGATRAAFATALTRTIAAQPGIAAASLTSRIPFGGARGANGIDVEGRTPAPGEIAIVDQRHITADYFRVMRIPLLSGRPFNDADDSRSEAVTVINRTMANQFWPGGNPIGHRVRLSGGFDSAHWIRIVGVVDDVRHVALSRPPVPEMYRPYAQAPARQFTIAVRTLGDPAAASGACRSAVQALDRDLPLYDLRTMDDRVAKSYADTRATAMLLALTAALSAVLAAIAIYGSIWHSVMQRLPEIGIRLALGAPRRSVGAQIVGSALSLTGVGALLGIAGARAAGPLVSGLLFETRSGDPRTLAAAVSLLTLVTLIAAVVPVRRALAVDIVAALRSE